MVHIGWLAALLGISAFMVLVLHGSLWFAHTHNGVREAQARRLASQLYWPVCGLVLSLAVIVLSIQPWLAESLNWRPELWILPMIGASGLVGLRFCLGARWNSGSFLCSAVFVCGLLSCGIFVYRHFGSAPQDKLIIKLNAETCSGCRRSALSSGIASSGALQCRL